MLNMCFDASFDMRLNMRHVKEVYLGIILWIYIKKYKNEKLSWKKKKINDKI